jgi:hypothetical protein
MKQFSDKIKMQAARLLSLEAYKSLCELKLTEIGFELPLNEESEARNPP